MKKEEIEKINEFISFMKKGISTREIGEIYTSRNKRPWIYTDVCTFISALRKIGILQYGKRIAKCRNFDYYFDYFMRLYYRGLPYEEIAEYYNNMKVRDVYKLCIGLCQIGIISTTWNTDGIDVKKTDYYKRLFATCTEVNSRHRYIVRGF